MKAAEGKVFKFGDNVDTDVIIPARYLNSSDPKELATHCMEDIDADFVHKVTPGDIIVATKNFGCGSSRDVCQNFLSKCNQHWTSDCRVPGGSKKDCRG